uniref:Uncharacterized protein n=1 Tax=Romanomermis culicivorax TaxID=13658 RepID=A0A915K785_ROMCU
MQSNRFFSESAISQRIIISQDSEFVDNDFYCQLDSSQIEDFSSSISVIRMSSTCLVCPTTSSDCWHLNEISDGDHIPRISDGDSDRKKAIKHNRLSTDQATLSVDGLLHLTNVSNGSNNKNSNKQVKINNGLLYDFRESTVSLPYDAVQQEFFSSSNTTDSSSSEGSFNLEDLKDKSIILEIRSSSRGTTVVHHRHFRSSSMPNLCYC